ncbi:RNA ligase-domain-containing protein [Globomyces pollinis-pini]|nr:RNA ligase-domain-containing protein [Globomyces pollinis-pini]
MDEFTQQLANLSLEGGKKKLIRSKVYKFKPQSDVEIPITSYNIDDYAYKKEGLLPTMARGLFIRDNNEIVIRGYDKFFNITEVPTTQWSYLESNTLGPYEVTVKENGCIIYMSAVDGHLLVTSKHALGPSNETRPSHAQVGEEWVNKHLKSVNKTRQELIQYLTKHKVSAVFELADDDFEEHVLEYTGDRCGLYAHGLNENTIEFKSKPSSMVQEFAKTFGFLLVDMIKMESIQEVKTFSDECAKTGCYKGMPVEGFVVRCSRFKNDQPDLKIVHFFKIKFDEPYLMFREWREVTRNRVIGGKPSKYKFRYELTNKYFEWAQAKYRQKPHLFSQFNQGKGIIKLRNMFLSEVQGIDNFIGTEMAVLCKSLGDATVAESESLGKDKTLVIPVATIGIGKSTLGNTLSYLFPTQFETIQNDNITQKKSAPVFYHNIMEAFQTHDFVYADKNNHLYQNREGLCTAFRLEYPAGKIIALDWGIDTMNPKELIQLTVARVVKRGENHQSLTPGTNPDFQKVISQFVYHRDPLNLEHDSDRNINQIVSLSIDNSVYKNVLEICKVLNITAPSEQVVNDAVEVVTNSTVSVKKVIKTTTKKQRLPLYYGVKITTDLLAVLDGLLQSHENVDVIEMWKKTVPFARKAAKKGYHATILLRKHKSSHAELLEDYDKRWSLSMENNSTPDDPLRMKAPISLTSTQLIWNSRTIALVIESTSPTVVSVNKYMHITIALLNDDAKPVESNAMIEEWYQNGNTDEIHSVTLQTIHFEGLINGFLY